MTEEQFRARARERGYGDIQTKDYVSRADGSLHTHDFAVMLLVLQGKFTLAFENGSSDFRAGDLCELAAGVVHTERAGPEGAKVLLAKRPSGAAVAAA